MRGRQSLVLGKLQASETFLPVNQEMTVTFSLEIQGSPAKVELWEVDQRKTPIRFLTELVPDQTDPTRPIFQGQVPFKEQETRFITFQVLAHTPGGAIWPGQTLTLAVAEPDRQTYEIATETISRQQGGTIAFADGTRLDIPPESLPEDTEITRSTMATIPS
ncbi:MAG: hypothetical protein HQM12_23695 [SAR324 cluster bacterium]|nr:hypothetical protein [SAR324 cluster bacterium]